MEDQDNVVAEPRKRRPGRVEPAKCRSCSAAIIWARTPAGKLMPIDANPDPVGNIRLDKDQQQAVILTAEEWFAAQDQPGDLHTSHFATCPDAGMWRNH